MIRPYSRLGAILYAIRAAIAHYRFARLQADSQINGISLVVSTRAPTADEMNTVGSRWSDWSRVQGAQPIDPSVIWADVTILWAALHRARQSSAS